MSKLQYFPEELQGMEESVVETYGMPQGELHVVRLFNTYGGLVPPMDAYAVLVGFDGEVIDSIRTNEPQELTDFQKLYK
jgi:hypothetical protein